MKKNTLILLALLCFAILAVAQEPDAVGVDGNWPATTPIPLRPDTAKGAEAAKEVVTTAAAVADAVLFKPKTIKIGSPDPQAILNALKDVRPGDTISVTIPIPPQMGMAAKMLKPKDIVVPLYGTTAKEIGSALASAKPKPGDTVKFLIPSLSDIAGSTGEPKPKLMHEQPWLTPKSSRVGLSLDAIGAGFLIYGIIENGKAANIINNTDKTIRSADRYRRAEDHAKYRNIAYITGAAFLLTGLEVQIHFSKGEK
jgi:hypothetical protein